MAIVCGAGIVSGKEIMCLELAHGLRDAGHEVHLITSKWGSGEFLRRAVGGGFAVHKFWLGYISATLRLDSVRMTADQLRRWPALLRSYRRFLRQEEPTRVIHTNWHHLLLLWPVLKPGRDVCWVHEVMPNNWQHRIFWRNLARRIGSFVAVSESARRGLLDLGLPRQQIEVVYNGIEDPAVSAAVRPANGSAVFGIVGQLGAWKGHEDLLEAFQSVHDSHPEARLHIYGSGAASYEAFLQQRAADLGISDSVMWRGFVSERAEIYSEIGVLVVPSRCLESFGLTALEAAFFALPVVASRCGGPAEIVEDRVTGLLFEPGNVAELAARLEFLIGNPAQCRQMGQQARIRALSMFVRSRLVREFTTLLSSNSSSVQ